MAVTRIRIKRRTGLTNMHVARVARPASLQAAHIEERRSEGVVKREALDLAFFALLTRDAGKHVANHACFAWRCRGRRWGHRATAGAVAAESGRCSTRQAREGSSELAAGEGTARQPTGR